MFYAIFAIILCIVATYFLLKWTSNDKSITSFVFFIFAFVAAMFLMNYGISEPVNGFEEPIIEQYELVPVVNDSNVYIIQQSDGSVICKFLSQNEKSSEVCIYTDDFEIVVTKEGEKPVFKTSLTKAKRTIFNLALHEEKKQIFYVPESNIERWQEKHVD